MKKEDLQLVGATACLIACKVGVTVTIVTVTLATVPTALTVTAVTVTVQVDERIPPMVDDFLYVCDDAYSRDQLMRMERKMLSVVGFDLSYSLTYRWGSSDGLLTLLYCSLLRFSKTSWLFFVYGHTFRIHSNVAINWEAKLSPRGRRDRTFRIFTS